MSFTQLWGVLLIFTLCPLLGALPLIQWITYGLARQNLTQSGTGNISVSAAFYHGGSVVGMLAVLSEALKGVAAVLLARYFFPADPTWEIIALIALVMGRYWISRGAGTTNVVWGYFVHDWISAGLIFLIGGVSFTIFRNRQSGKLAVLVLLPLITALRHPEQGSLIGATLTLSILLGWILHKIPDDLNLSDAGVQQSSRQMFRFFRGDRSILTLDQPLKPDQVGQKAATLAQLKQWGYPVPMGWVLPPGDDPAPLVESLHPSPEQPLVVRSSAIGEDSETSSAAGQYESILNITSSPTLEQAIFHCQASYNLPRAVHYRRDREVQEEGMAVLVQVQVQGGYSGVAFSRDPMTGQGDAVIIEALPGMAKQVVSGQFTPKRYQVWVRAEDLLDRNPSGQTGSASLDPDWLLPAEVQLRMAGDEESSPIPPQLIQQVAYLARHVEMRYHGIPQDIEWSYDGQHLWLLQARPITTLLPIWTRKIAAEVIPGYIHPLTWSINRPLTCGVWGEIFSIVLGQRADALDFNATATLHYSAAYFNASLLGQIFRLMGLPPESLEFLTRGAKFSKPPLRSTLRNLPGLLRLIQRELRLPKDFEQAMQDGFRLGLAELAEQSIESLDPEELLKRIYRILRLLKQATYFSILAPLSVALRQSIFQVKETNLDNSQTPEVASVRSLQMLAASVPLPLTTLNRSHSDAIFATLAGHPAGQAVLRQFDQILERYGYLSEVATDIAVPRWRENPQPLRELFTQFLLNPFPASPPTDAPKLSTWKTRQVQPRLNLKGQVTAIYSQLLAELRWSFLALEQRWLSTRFLAQPGDIFFLTFDEIEQLVTDANPALPSQIPERIAQRRSQLEHDRQRVPPMLIYGNHPSIPTKIEATSGSTDQLRGIGASPGTVEGCIKVLHTLQAASAIDRNTILVVPYTDSGWAPLLAQAGGLIAEVGGQLSHGAIVAREYGIPAVMDIHGATQLLRDGQRVRLNGQQGTVDILV